MQSDSDHEDSDSEYASLDSLPDEIIVQVLHRLGARDLDSLACVNRNLRNLATDEDFWQPFVTQALAHDKIVLPLGRSWRQHWHHVATAPPLRAVYLHDDLPVQLRTSITPDRCVLDGFLFVSNGQTLTKYSSPANGLGKALASISLDVKIKIVGVVGRRLLIDERACVSLLDSNLNTLVTVLGDNWLPLGDRIVTTDDFSEEIHFLIDPKTCEVETTDLRWPGILVTAGVGNGDTVAALGAGLTCGGTLRDPPGVVDFFTLDSDLTATCFPVQITDPAADWKASGFNTFTRSTAKIFVVGTSFLVVHTTYDRSRLLRVEIVAPRPEGDSAEPWGDGAHDEPEGASDRGWGDGASDRGCGTWTDCSTRSPPGGSCGGSDGGGSRSCPDGGSRSCSDGSHNWPACRAARPGPGGNRTSIDGQHASLVEFSASGYETWLLYVAMLHADCVSITIVAVNSRAEQIWSAIYEPYLTRPMECVPPARGRSLHLDAFPDGCLLLSYTSEFVPRTHLLLHR
eukprot:TRINITY_DN26568_c0_g1_i1.p1 TRINITY_DN26568_c0_g1~~TRINITY_DN26568_c0_g1_i1.p1  ORF type:complete len:514 (+),score=123.07 TRINITY_DN26568_c0_g1_i1:126-1667(+)